MKTFRLILCLLGFVLLVKTAKALPPQYAYRITFTDKKGTASLSNPLLFLSNRAITRRSRMGITVDSTDLPVSPAYIDSVLTLLPGSKLHVTSRWLNDCVVLVTDSNQIAGIKNKHFVKSTAFIAYYPTGLHKTAINKFSLEKNSIINSGTNRGAHKTSGSGAYYGVTIDQTKMVNGDFLHDAGYKGQGMLIAIFDAGFIGTNTHIGFDSLRNGNLLDVHNFVLNTDSIYDYDTHGTVALSTMAGYMPSKYVGSAPLAQYALYVTEDNNSEQPIEMDNMLAASERADSLGADVISVSLGYDYMDGNFSLMYADIDGITTTGAKAANIATKKGILFVPSAGNDGGTPWHYILSPGDADSALTVGAVYSNGAAVPFSGYGPNAAGRIKPDVCDLGSAVSVFNATTDSDLATEDGTSFSTPQIAGWAACLRQANNKALPFAVRNAIIQSADHYSNPDSELGYGIPDFSKAMQLLSINDTIPTDTTNWITVSPNPFTSFLTIKLMLATVQYARFYIYDATGRKVFQYGQMIDSWKNSVVQLPIGSSLASGIYFMSVSAGYHRAVVKMLKL
jgi:hypothetical protein